MNLVEFLTTIGDAEAARLFGVKVRTVQSWRLRDRIPRPQQAAIIVSKSPVTYEGIYGSSSEVAAAE